MIVVCGKERKGLGAEDLRVLADGFSRVVLDVGTGDGKNVLKSAAARPDTLFIGLDAAAENMQDASRRAAKKKEKGGLPNVLFVVGAAENPPEELTGIADELTIFFPWGSLLEAAAKPIPEVLKKLALCAKDGAEFTIVLTYSPLYEAAEIEKRELPLLSPEWITGQYTEALKSAGYHVEETDILSNEYAAQFDSAWAKRLAFGRKRDFYRVTGRISTETAGDDPRPAAIIP